jgi:hypothetical protein
VPPCPGAEGRSGSPTRVRRSCDRLPSGRPRPTPPVSTGAARSRRRCRWVSAHPGRPGRPAGRRSWTSSTATTASRAHPAAGWRCTTRCGRAATWSGCSSCWAMPAATPPTGSARPSSPSNRPSATCSSASVTASPSTSPRVAWPQRSTPGSSGWPRSRPARSGSSGRRAWRRCTPRARCGAPARSRRCSAPCTPTTWRRSAAPCARCRHRWHPTTARCARSTTGCSRTSTASAGCRRGSRRRSCPAASRRWPPSART